MKKYVVITFAMFLMGITSSFAYNNGEVNISIESTSFVNPSTTSKPAFINSTVAISFFSYVELLGSHNAVITYLREYGGNDVHSYRISDGQVVAGSPYGYYSGTWTTLTLFASVRNARAVVGVAW